jgi:hypothetical protein
MSPSPTIQELEAQAMQAHYARCPNDSTRWYPSGPGLPIMPEAIFTVHVEQPVRDREIQDLWKVVLRCRAYGTVTPVIIARFPDFPDYLEYCGRNGVISKPGINHLTGPNVWD